MSGKKSILERLDAGEIIIGDGGYVTELERRGYVTGGLWTPEVNVEHPKAVKGLHREFKRAGADVLQAFTFHASGDRVINGHSLDEINQKACESVKKVSAGETLLCGGVCTSEVSIQRQGKEAARIDIEKQLEFFQKHGLDFVLAEYISHIEIMEWVIGILKQSGKPIAATMNIGPLGDPTGVTTKECAVRMAKAGADIVGLNCCFDPDWCIKGIKLMKEGLEEAGLKRHLMLQPLGFRTPDAGRDGYLSLPEFPFALEPRLLTRFEVHKYARDAYNAGVRYLGGCCGFESYHIRAIAEELSKERQRLPPASEKNVAWGGGAALQHMEHQKVRNGRQYWENVAPHCGCAERGCLSKAVYPIPPELQKYC